jgi:hypothetical protein
VEGAIVELLHTQSMARGMMTRADGRFAFDSIPIGEYELRVRRIGLVGQQRALSITGAADTVRVELQSAADVDSLQQAALQRKLADARSRPRRWTCRVSDDDIRTTAAASADRFLGDAYRGSSFFSEMGLPATRAAFLRDFRGVRDTTECRRLLEAIDRQFGLVDDQLRVFRIGRVYFFPDFGDGGMFVGLDGKILGILIVPS